MTLDEIAARFSGAAPHGAEWRALCPMHDDRRPSLAIAEGKEMPPRRVVRCRAGCPTGEVLASVGLSFGDLFDHEPTDRRSEGSRRRIVAAYDYADAGGNLLFQKVRYEPKTFSLRRPDGNGGWISGLDESTPRPLYRLPEVIAAIRAGRHLWLVEGEKDAEAVRREGEVATTSYAGAGKGADATAAQLFGAAHVHVVADNDDAGRSHARNVLACLWARDTPASGWLPAQNHKDVADHLGAGLSLNNLVPLESDRTS